MIPAELTGPEIAHLAQKMRARGEPFAIATVLRTVGSTAAKPGAKALLDVDGAILQGWIGGGCVKGALIKATKRAISEGQPQFVSLLPQDLLDEKGVASGDDIDGVRFARNGCPSKGSMDIFVELIVPQPELLIFGASPVAQALMQLAPQFDWDVRSGTPDTKQAPLPVEADRMIVVATQGAGDLTSLKAALGTQSSFVAFVGSHRKFNSLSEKLIAEGMSPDALSQVKAPAGLAIGAVTPEEIALSILAQLTAERRRHQRGERDEDV